MPTYSITHAQRTDGYAVLTTLEGTDIGTGQVVTVDDLPAGFAFTGSQVVLAVPVISYSTLTRSFPTSCYSKAPAMIGHGRPWTPLGCWSGIRCVRGLWTPT